MKSEEEIVFCFADLTKLLFSQKKKLFRVGWICFTTSFLFLLLSQVQFKSSGIFQEVVERKSEIDLFKNFLSFTKDITLDLQAASLMKTERILKPVIQKLGLQANIKDQFFLTKVFKRIFSNLWIELGYRINDPDRFIFNDVVYEDNECSSFYIRFSSPSTFELLDINKKHLLSSSIGQICRIDLINFILKKVPKNLKINKSYSLTFFPVKSYKELLEKAIKITPDKENESILHLTCVHADRNLSYAVVNVLMEEYQNYLKHEVDRISKAEIAYLSKKQEDLFDQLKRSLDQSVAYQQKVIETRGFLGFQDQVKGILTPYHKCLDEMAVIDLKLKRIQSFNDENGSIGYFFKELKEIYQEIETLKSDKGIVELAIPHAKYPIESKTSLVKILGIDFSHRPYSLESDFFTSLSSLTKELGITNKKIEEVKISLNDLSQKNEIAYNQMHLSLLDENDKKQLLKEHFKLLSLKKNILQKRIFSSSSPLIEMEGVDLKTAQTLCLSYNKKIDATKVAIHYLIDLKDQIQRGIDIGSLSSIITDKIALELVQKGSNISFLLQDKKNRSEKEKSRLSDDLSYLKNVLYHHLDQMEKVEKLQEKLYKEKIIALQRVIADRIDQKIFLLKQKEQDFISSLKVDLLMEKGILATNLKELQLKMVDIPEEWRLEKELQFKTDMVLKMIDGIAKGLEQKTIGTHLNQIQSKPIDLASIPMTPLKPHLLLFSCFWAIVGMIFWFFKVFLKGTLKGFSLSKEVLISQNKEVCGTLCFSCNGVTHFEDQDLETLRKVSSFVCHDFAYQKKRIIASLLQSNGYDYAYSLAKLLSKKNYRVLVMQTSFPAIYEQKKTEGWVDFLEGKTDKLNIENNDGFDVLFSGRATRFGAELISSLAFLNFINTLKEKYEIILLTNNAMPQLAEARAFLLFSDKVVLTLDRETKDQIKPFFEWENYKKTKCLSFIFCSKD